MNEYRKFWENHWQTHSKLLNEDPHRQVARTKFGITISENVWNRTCQYIIAKLKLENTDTVIDLCCGNGLLSAHLVNHVKKIIAVDYSEILLNKFVIDDKRILKIFSDANKFDFGSYEYDCVIMYFSVQHFSEREILKITKKIFNNLKKGGVFFIGDVPDIKKKWKYFNKEKFRDDYFNSLENGKPIIGTWFEREFFKYMCKYIGYSNINIESQPEFMINSKHRYDVYFYK